MNQELMLVDLTVSAEQMPAAELAIRDEIERVNAELDIYTSHASTGDYALATACGILSGVIDALYVGEAPIVGEGADDARGKVHEQVNRFIENFAKDRGFEDKGLKGAIEHLENNYKVAQDNIWKDAGIGVSAKEHHLADLAHHPTPLGLASAIAVQFFKVGFFVNNNGEYHLLRIAETDTKEIAKLVIPIVITGFLNWIVWIVEARHEDKTGEKAPEAITKLAHVAASTPMFIELVKCANNWFGHLVSDMGGSKNTAGDGMGIPGFFFSLLYELASLPGVNKTGLTNYLNYLYTKQKFDLRHELVVVEALNKQAVPVLINEALVRTGYFVSRLARQLDEHGNFEDVDWSSVVPIGNRTIDRMLTVSSLTLSFVDSADAVTQACLKSAGNWVIFSEKLVARFNYVAAGRAAIAIVREISDDARETELLREKRLLVEAKADMTIERLERYQALLEEHLTAYLVEDLQLFFEGFSQMDRGLLEGNSDLVIAGNVTIQRVLGRGPQFTSQQEFDTLMASDDEFVF